jgi:N-acetyl-alpha-D-glucosaminyl L-malate synthase BshA
MKTITRYAIESSDIVTAVSNYLRDETYRIFNVTREIEVIYNFIDPKRHECPPSPSVPAPGSPHQVTVMHISNFRPLKRVGDVIEIFAGIRKAMDARLLLVGDGRESMKAEQMTRDLGLEGSVVFMGVVDEVHPLLAAADLLLLPSESESFGMAALEAMASGVPVIGSAVGGIPEVVEHGVTGYLAPVGDVPAMTEYAVRLLSKKIERKRVSAEARRIAAERFSYPRIISRYESLYSKIIGEQEGGTQSQH